MTGDGWSGGGACLPATQMAIEDVNANRDILKNYNLTYTWIDSKVRLNPKNTFRYAGTSMYHKRLLGNPVGVLISFMWPAEGR